MRVGAGLHADGGHLRTTRPGLLRRTKAGKLWVQGRQKRCAPVCSLWPLSGLFGSSNCVLQGHEHRCAPCCHLWSGSLWPPPATCQLLPSSGNRQSVYLPALSAPSLDSSGTARCPSMLTCTPARHMHEATGMRSLLHGCQGRHALNGISLQWALQQSASLWSAMQTNCAWAFRFRQCRRQSISQSSSMFKQFNLHEVVE